MPQDAETIDNHSNPAFVPGGWAPIIESERASGSLHPNPVLGTNKKDAAVVCREQLPHLHSCNKTEN
jgi:hypothetical protein